MPVGVLIVPMAGLREFPREAEVNIQQRKNNK